MRQKINIYALSASDVTSKKHRNTFTAANHLRARSYLIASALVFGLATSSIAQDRTSSKEDFLKLTDGKQIPSSLLMKDLNKDWRKVTIEPNEQRTGSDYYASTIYKGILNTLGFGVYFTKGESVRLGDQTFLVVYSVKNNMNRQQLQQAIQRASTRNGQNSNRHKFEPDTQLTLSLLNLKSNGSINGIQPFSPQSEIMGPADYVEASDQSLRRIGTYLSGLSQRYRAYGGQGFQIKDRQTLTRMMVSYFHAPEAVFIQPGSKQPYSFNQSLRNVRPDKVVNKNKLVVFYEAKVGTDGKRGSVFFDGHSERIPEWKLSSVLSVKPQGPTAQSLRAQSMRNLQLIGATLRRYTRHSGGNLPPMESISIASRTLMNSDYRSRNAFVNSGSNEPYPYRANALLSRKKLADIVNQKELVAFYESKVGSDGKIGVVYLSGTTARIPEYKWKQVKAVPVQMKTPKKA